MGEKTGFPRRIPGSDTEPPPEEVGRHAHPQGGLCPQTPSQRGQVRSGQGTAGSHANSPTGQMPCGEDGILPPRSSRQRHAIPVQRGEKEQTNATRGAPNTSSSKLPRSAHKNRASLRNPQPEDTRQLPVPCVMRVLVGPSTPAGRPHSERHFI